VQRARRVGARGHVVLAALGLAAGLSTGVAAAYWTGGGTGSGSAAAGTAAPLTTVTATASASSLLYPGGSAHLTLTVRNPNPYAVTITSVTGNGLVTASGGSGLCVTTGVSFSPPTAGLPFTVPAAVGAVQGTVVATLEGAAQMSSASDSGCQGATFTIPVALAGQSA
jgi:hypothetical protein